MRSLNINQGNQQVVSRVGNVGVQLGGINLEVAEPSQTYFLSSNRAKFCFGLLCILCTGGISLAVVYLTDTKSETSTGVISDDITQIPTSAPLSTPLLLPTETGSSVITYNPSPNPTISDDDLDCDKIRPALGQFTTSFNVSSDVFLALVNYQPYEAFLYAKEGNTMYSLGVPAHSSHSNSVNVSQQVISLKSEVVNFPILVPGGLGTSDSEADIYEKAKSRAVFLACAKPTDDSEGDAGLSPSDYVFGKICEWTGSYCNWIDRTDRVTYPYDGSEYEISNPSDLRFFNSQFKCTELTRQSSAESDNDTVSLNGYLFYKENSNQFVQGPASQYFDPSAVEQVDGHVKLSYMPNEDQTLMLSSQIVSMDKFKFQTGLKVIASFEGLPLNMPLNVIATTAFTYKLFPTDNTCPVIYSGSAYVQCDSNYPNIFNEVDLLEGGYFANQDRMDDEALYQIGLQPWQITGNIAKTSIGELDAITAKFEDHGDCIVLSLFSGNLMLSETDNASPLYQRTDCRADNPSVPLLGEEFRFLLNVWNVASAPWDYESGAAIETTVLNFDIDFAS